MAEPCPRCGYPTVAEDKCPQCGVMVDLYRASLDKLRRGPGGPPAGGGEAPAEVRAALRNVLWLVGLLMVPVAMVGARRYRLSRMSWRGIRFSFRGRARQFVGIFVVGTILTSLTAGLYYPVFATQRQAFMVSHAYFGSRKFDFDGRGRDLMRPFLVMVLLFLPTLGLSWFRFSARRQRYFTDHTPFRATRFRPSAPGRP